MVDKKPEQSKKTVVGSGGRPLMVRGVGGRVVVRAGPQARVGAWRSRGSRRR